MIKRKGGREQKKAGKKKRRRERGRERGMKGSKKRGEKERGEKERGTLNRCHKFESLRLPNPATISPLGRTLGTAIGDERCQTRR